MNFNQILETYGIPGLAIIATILVLVLFARVLYLAAQTLFTRSNSDTKQDDTFRELLVSLNEERKLAQDRNTRLEQSNNHLQADVFAVREKLAEEIGRRAEIKEAHERDRAERIAERAADAAKLREMQTSILDLQKNQRDNQAKIREFEGQIETLNTQIANKDGVISSLQEKVTQLETEKSQLLALNTELSNQLVIQTNRADSGWKLVEELNKIDVPPTPPVIPQAVNDNTQAILDMRDVDDTIHPLPVPTETKPPDAEKPAA